MLKLSQLIGSPLFVIAGPCVIESAEQCLQVASHMKQVCDKLGFVYVFKASFDKANRSSNAGFRGPGLEDGLVVLKRVKDEVGVPVLTDIHEAGQAAEAATVIDILQVPAFLARQTDLLHAVGHTGRLVNVKKGQFMSPMEMANAVHKVRAATPEGQPHPGVMLSERGTFFGYSRLVNDFTGLSTMKSINVPVIFDVTHSTQTPASLGQASGGNPQYSPMLARAAVATGCVDGLFLECHPNPREAKSDAATVLDLKMMEPLLTDCARIVEMKKSWLA